MNSLSTQLHVPPEQARELAEELVSGTFKCPLGGDYVLADPHAVQIRRQAQPSANGTEELPPPGEPTRDGAVTSPTGTTSERKLWTSTAA
jgi:hypothetical protein